MAKEGQGYPCYGHDMMMMMMMMIENLFYFIYLFYLDVDLIKMLKNCSYNVSSSSSSSSCRAISTDIPDPLSPHLHCFWQIFRATSRIGTELLYVGSSWTSSHCSSMWRGPQEHIPYELVSTSPAVFRVSGLSNFDSFRDGWLVAAQLLLCGVLSQFLPRSDRVDTAI